MTDSENSAVSSIAYAIKQCRPYFAELSKKHGKDEASKIVAERIIKHLKLAGFSIERSRRPLRGHSTHPKAEELLSEMHGAELDNMGRLYELERASGEEDEVYRLRIRAIILSRRMNA